MDNTRYPRRILAVAIAQLLASTAASAATFVVDTDSDADADGNGNCSLREAWNNATDNAQTFVDCPAGEAGSDGNGDPLDVITFAGAGQTIALQSALPTSTDDLTLTGSTTTLDGGATAVCDNDGTADAGEFRLLDASSSQLRLSDLTLTRGCADDGLETDQYGAAVRIRSGSLVVDNSTITMNVGRYGYAIHAVQSTVAISQSTLDRSYQGGLSARYGSVQISQSLVADNDRAGLYLYASTLTLANTRVEGNAGYGINLEMGGAASLSDAWLDGNGRSGLSAPGDAAIEIERSIIVGNDGEGVVVVGGTEAKAIGGPSSLTIRASTVSGNDGNGVDSRGAATVDIRDTTIADNAGYALAVGNATTSFSLVRSLLLGGGGSDACDFYALNLATVDANIEGTDGTASCSYNAMSLASAASLATISLTPLVPRSGTLVHIPGPGSVAIDAAGDCSSDVVVDQVGTGKPVGSACDVGALEVTELSEAAQAGPAFTVNDFTDAGDGICGSDPGECTLRDAVIAANDDGASSTIEFSAADQAIGLLAALPMLTEDLSVQGNNVSITRAGDRCVLNDLSPSSEFRLFYATNAALSLTSVSLTNGCADGHFVSFDHDEGGAIWVLDGSLTVTDAELSGNQAYERGGAIHAYRSDLLVERATLSGNSAARDGGTIAIGDDGTGIQASIIDSYLVDNVTGEFGQGGGVACDRATLTLTGSTLSGNRANGRGGGLYAEACTVTIERSTFSGNTVGFAGGGAYMTGGTADLADTTFYANRAYGAVFESEQLRIRDAVSNVFDRNLMANSPAASYNPCNIYNVAFTSQVGNLEANVAGAQTDCGGVPAVTTSSLSLQPLADNGGPTPTHALAVGSSAIDAGGTCTTTDQRGATKPYGAACDTGAVEFFNTPVSAADALASTPEDAATSGTVVGPNITDNPDDDDSGTITVSAVGGNPANVGVDQMVDGATINIAANGDFTFDPNGAFEALDDSESQDVSLSFTADDGLSTDTANLTVTVNGVNDAPVTDDVATAVAENGQSVIGLSGSDVDIEPLTFVEVGSESLVTVAGTDATFDPGTTFDALDENATAQVTFQFQAFDGDAYGNTATGTLTVQGSNDLPVGNPASGVTDEDTVAALTLTAIDPDDTSLTYSLVSGGGSFSITGDELSFDPGAGFQYLDTGEQATAAFEFRAHDGTAYGPVAGGEIVISGVNDAPVANDVADSLDENGLAAVTLSATDVDDTALAFSLVSGAPVGASISGSTLSYDPANRFDSLVTGGTATVTLQFVANDGEVDSVAATAMFTITGSNDVPVAADVNDTISQDQVSSLALSATDPDDSSFSWSLVTGAPAGASINGQTLSYDPAGRFDDLGAGEQAMVTFQFIANDGEADSAPATATITITGANDAPAADPVATATGENEDLSLTLTGSDPDGDPLTFSLVAPAPQGLSISGADQLQFAPGTRFDSLTAGATAMVDFQVVANDGSADSAPAAGSITINGVNDAPLALDDVYSIAADELLSVDVADGLLANDTDVEGDALAVDAGTFSPGGGTLTLAADGSFSYQAPSTPGTVTFDYTVRDGNGGSSPGTLTITVTEANAADLSITKSDGVEIVAPDDLLNYTIVVSNAGPADATGAFVEDLLPASLSNGLWTCTADANSSCADSGEGSIQESIDVAAAESVTFSLTATVAPEFANDLIINSASVTAPAMLGDPDLSNNVAEDVNFSDGVFADGFESGAKRLDFSRRVVKLHRAEITGALSDDGLPVLIAQGHTPSRGAVQIHARSVYGVIELQISRLEHGQWQLGRWQAMTGFAVTVHW